jgi:hypothetical protein
MQTTCKTCKLEYDDARSLTFCPHEPIASDAILARKDQAYKVFDSRKKYRVKGTDIEGTVSSIDHAGMISFSGTSIYVLYDPFSLEEIT